MKTTKRAAIYVRVSTDGQSVANQEIELQGIAARHGWDVVEVFADRGISGAKGRDKRPGLHRLMTGVARKEFDIVASWSVDRLGRSLQDLVVLLGEMHAKGIDLYLHQQGIDTTTPAGKALFQMLGVFAEFERSMIRERVNAGLRRAKAKGTKLGRPPVDAKREDAVRKLLRQGLGIRKAAITAGVGTSTAQRIAREMRAA